MDVPFADARPVGLAAGHNPATAETVFGRNLFVSASASVAFDYRNDPRYGPYIGGNDGSDAYVWSTVNSYYPDQIIWHDATGSQWTMQVIWRGVGAGNQAVFEVGDATADRISLILDDLNGDMECQIRAGATNLDMDIHVAPGWRTGDWNDFVVTYDRTLATPGRYYVNGRLSHQTSLNSAAQALNLDQVWLLDSWAFAGTTGDLALCRLWNRALSVDEVAHLHQNPWQIYEVQAPSISVPVGSDADVTGTSAMTLPVPTSTATAFQFAPALTRTSGTAPLAVLFDASDLQSGITTQPFFECEFDWDFGDSGSGLYDYGNQESKNTAKGPVASHTYADTGSYDWTLTIRWPDNTTSTHTGTVTVNDPDTVYSGTSTVVISRDGDFTGAPSGANEVTTTSWATVRSHLNADTRVLLRRGEAAWTVDATHAFGNTNTGGTLGAFGTGSTPQINSGVDVFTFAGEDWRIMDLDFTDTDQQTNIFIQDDGSASGNRVQELLIYRCTITDFDSINQIGHGQEVNAAYTDGENHGPLYWFENVFSHPFSPPTQTAGQWLCSADRLAFVGNSFTNPNEDHFGLRHVWVRRSVWSNNTIAGNNDGAQALFRIHTLLWDNSNNNYDNMYSEKLVISGNHIDVEGGANCNIGTVNPGDQRFRHIIVERNFLQASAAGGTAEVFQIQTANATGEDTTHVRFNVFSRVEASDCLNITRNSGNPTALQPTGIRVYRNTCFTDDTSATWNVFLIASGIAAGEVTVHSNFMQADNVTTINPAQDNSAGADVGDNVTANDAASNHFVTDPPTAPSHFRLLATSTAVDAARTGEPELYRYDLVQIPDGRTLDCGAWEHGLDVSATASSTLPVPTMATTGVINTTVSGTSTLNLPVPTMVASATAPITLEAADAVSMGSVPGSQSAITATKTLKSLQGQGLQVGRTRQELIREANKHSKPPRTKKRGRKVLREMDRYGSTDKGGVSFDDFFGGRR